MKASPEAISLIKEFEGLRTTAYICPAGYRTIGYGHLMAMNDNRQEIDIEEAEMLLSYDVRQAEQSVLRNIDVPLTIGQFDALVSFTFNLGSASLQRSTLRQKINRQEHEAVRIELMRWVYVNGRIIPGLCRRRRAELRMYES